MSLGTLVHQFGTNTFGYNPNLPKIIPTTQKRVSKQITTKPYSITKIPKLLDSFTT